MKILVTGGAGFIGSHTAVALTDAGYEPVIIDNLSNSKAFIVDRIAEITGKKIPFYQGDCRDKNFLKKVFEAEGTVGGVIHFAAWKAVGESTQKPLAYYENNLQSLIAVLEMMISYNVPHFVFSSSATVYGEPEKNPIDESSQLKQANSPYGSTKVVCEEIIRDVVRSAVPIKTIALRYFNPIGAHPSALIGELPIGTPNNLVPFVTQVAAGLREKLVIYGNDYNTPDGTCVRDYIHVVDLARAHVDSLNYLATQTAPFFDAFNVGTGKGTSVLEVAKAFEKVSGLKLHYEIGQRRKGDVVSCYAEAKKIKDLMGWEARLSVEDALSDAWKWQKSLEK